jgi:hypothetical protein
VQRKPSADVPMAALEARVAPERALADHHPVSALVSRKERSATGDVSLGMPVFATWGPASPRGAAFHLRPPPPGAGAGGFLERVALAEGYQ